MRGAFERNDMMQYFGEQPSGFAFTRHGWVQSSAGPGQQGRRRERSGTFSAATTGLIAAN